MSVDPLSGIIDAAGEATGERFPHDECLVDLLGDVVHASAGDARANARPGYSPGGKSGAGVYQTIINAIPPHRFYVEAFLGGGGVLLNKRHAEHTIAIDRDADLIARWREAAAWGRCDFPASNFVAGDALELLPKMWPELSRGGFVYCDPPYMPETRSRRVIYLHEMTAVDHRQLLRVAIALPCKVMISGYPSRLYDELLEGWRRRDIYVTGRAGRHLECLWMNYAPPTELHDYRHLGVNFRERERIRRRQRRWCKQLAALPVLERKAMLSTLAEVGDGSDR